jgi:hypothetical protein
MRLFRWPSAAIFVLSLILLTPGLLAQSNGVKSIQTVGANVEITVNSAQEFDVRDEVVTLQIGSRNFSHLHSRNGIRSPREMRSWSAGAPTHPAIHEISARWTRAG